MSGGVAQNIKANKCIAELDDLNQLFIPPGPGDESICIGAAWLQFIKKGGEIKDIPIQTNAYFGLSYKKNDIKSELDKIDMDNFNVKEVAVQGGRRINSQW